MMPNSTINELKRAVAGLLYMSETDEPLHAFTWKDGGSSLTVEKLRELSKTDPSTKIEEVPLDDFFSTQTEGYEGQGAEETERVEKFKNLSKLIEERLSDVKAFRVGEVNVRYYVVGKTKQGDWAGIWTSAVET